MSWLNGWYEDNARQVLGGFLRLVELKLCLEYEPCLVQRAPQEPIGARQFVWHAAYSERLNASRK